MDGAANPIPHGEAPPPPPPFYDWRGGDCRVRRLAAARVFTAIFAAMGLASTGSFFLLLPKHPYWISITGVLVFGGLACLGYHFRDNALMRERADHPHEMVYLYSSIVLSVVVAYVLEVHQLDFRVFILSGVGIFSLVMVTQPVFDYGVMQSFVSLPLPMAVFHFKLKFNVWYVPCIILVLLAMYLQYYFARHFNDLYNTPEAAQARRARRAHRAAQAALAQAADPAQAAQDALAAQAAQAAQATLAAQTAQAAQDALTAQAAQADEAARATRAAQDAQAALAAQAAEAARAALAALAAKADLAARAARASRAAQDVLAAQAAETAQATQAAQAAEAALAALAAQAAQLEDQN